MGDLDRRKHVVDVMERVLGGVRDRLHDDEAPTHTVDVGPSSGAVHSTLELTIGIADDHPRGHHESDHPPPRRRS